MEPDINSGQYPCKTEIETGFGHCRCCLEEGHHRDITKLYLSDGKQENYSDIFLDCFNIFLSTNTNLSTLICTSCVCRLRNAQDFKNQVMRTEHQLMEALHDCREEQMVLVNVPVAEDSLDTTVGFKINVNDVEDTKPCNLADNMFVIEESMPGQYPCKTEIETGFGLCRCCLEEGHHRDITKLYLSDGKQENYSDIFLDCFNLFLSTNTNLSTLICTSCVCRLHDAQEFKSQVMRTERQLLEALHHCKNEQMELVNVPVAEDSLDTTVGFNDVEDTKPCNLADNMFVIEESIPEVPVAENSLDTTVGFKINVNDVEDTKPCNLADNMFVVEESIPEGLPLNGELVLSLLQDGNCSDLEVDDTDEEFVAPQLESEDLAPNEVPCVADPTLPCKRGKKRKTPTIVAQDNDAGGPSSSKKRKNLIKVKVSQRPRIWKKTNFIDKPHHYFYHPKPVVIRSPIEYFLDYYNDDFFEHMSVCTNMYHMRKTGDTLKTTKQEMKILYGIHLMMGILSYPRIAMYWRQKINIDMITSAMTRDRLTTLRNNLHIVETDSPPIQAIVNPLWKVQPVINAVKNGCKKILRTPGRYSVDVQMIPFTGKCHLRQFVKNKPRPVGLKNFVVTTSEGLMLDFEIYYGQNPALSHPLGPGPAVVLRLVQSVPRGSCVFFDRYFTTIPLLDELMKLGYHGTGAIMANRIPQRQKLSFKDDKKMKKGDIEQRVSNDIVLVKWKDSKAVLTASNCTGGTATEIVKRYEKKQKCYVDVDAPKIVTSYNAFMGGVDVLDQSMEYYRTFMQTRKWTLKVILHFMDLAVVNAWRLHRCDSLAKGIPKHRIQDLLAFRFEIAETLIYTPDRDRLESSPLVDIQNNMSSRYKPANNPSVGKRYDGYGHMPAFDDIKAPRKCRFESCSSRSKIRCRKCDVYLCLSRDKDCFYLYHTK